MVPPSHLPPDPNRPRREWDFQPSATVPPPTAAEAADVPGAIEFDPSDRLVATGGIARKIKIYDAASFLPGSDAGPPVCGRYICTPAKLSSLRWKPAAAAAVVGAADYDGVVTEYDLERLLPVFERDEHGGRRVWSVDYSRRAPHVGASASDDGTAQLWDSRCHSAAAAVLRPSGAAVCSAEFDPADGARVGLGCADTNAYVYDVRAAARPLAVLRGHARTVAYVRFDGAGRVLTASTDGTIKMWSGADPAPAELRTFRGHTNARSFVGLAVWRGGGLIGCGSESNEVFAYDARWSEPVWVQGFGGDGRDRLGADKGFVSAVAWRHGSTDDECLAVAGGSDGALRAWVGKRRSRTTFETFAAARGLLPAPLPTARGLRAAARPRMALAQPWPSHSSWSSRHSWPSRRSRPSVPPPVALFPRRCRPWPSPRDPRHRSWPSCRRSWPQP